MTTIPVSQIVQVTPSVEAAGGSNLVLNGLFLTENTRVPTGAVLSFASTAAVLSYFGAGSTEYSIAANYFNGFDTATKKPASMLFAQCPYNAPTSAFLRGGAVTATVAQFNFTTSGSFSIVIDGATFAAVGLNFAAATSYSNIAAIVQTELQSLSPTLGTCTASISGTTMTVTGTPTTTLYVGQVISGTGVTAGTVITALGTGTGGAGTYTVSPSQTEATSETFTIHAAAPTCTYDSVSGAFVITSGASGTNSTIAFATGTGNTILNMALGATAGGVISQGAAQVTTTTISAYMTGLAAINGNWAGFTTLFEPTLGATALVTDKVAFAQWVATTNDMYWYAMWDSNQVPCGQADTSSAGYTINQLGIAGVCCIGYDATYSTSAACLAVAAFALGVGASLDFTRTNGRQTLAFRTQAGLATTVGSLTTANNLIANGYNYYGAYGNAGNNFVAFYNGSISGQWKWWDSYVNQIQLNNNCQTVLFQLLLLIGNIPYTPYGYGLIRSALYGGNTGQIIGTQPTGSTTAVGPIAQALNYGTMRAGVQLSSTQIAAVNNQAGIAIDGYLNQQGWYLQIKDPGATVREARGSPVMTLWYMDGQTVQAMNLASVDVL